MAKAKQSKTAAKPSATAEKSTDSKSAGSSQPPQSTAAPLIDTSLAAATAANMIVNRDRLASSEKQQSGGFKQLKQSLNKPASQGPASFLQSTAPRKKSNLPFGGRKQVGHNQTFGADVNRSSVPRRTGGG